MWNFKWPWFWCDSLYWFDIYVIKLFNDPDSKGHVVQGVTINKNMGSIMNRHLHRPIRWPMFGLYLVLQLFGIGPYDRWMSWMPSSMVFCKNVSACDLLRAVRVLNIFVSWKSLFLCSNKLLELGSISLDEQSFNLISTKVRMMALSLSGRLQELHASIALCRW